MSVKLFHTLLEVIGLKMKIRYEWFYKTKNPDKVWVKSHFYKRPKQIYPNHFKIIEEDWVYALSTR